MESALPLPPGGEQCNIMQYDFSAKMKKLKKLKIPGLPQAQDGFHKQDIATSNDTVGNSLGIVGEYFMESTSFEHHLGEEFGEKKKKKKSRLDEIVKGTLRLDEPQIDPTIPSHQMDEVMSEQVGSVRREQPDLSYSGQSKKRKKKKRKLEDGSTSLDSMVHSQFESSPEQPVNKQPETNVEREEIKKATYKEETGNSEDSENLRAHDNPHANGDNVGDETSADPMLLHEHQPPKKNKKKGNLKSPPTLNDIIPESQQPILGAKSKKWPSPFRIKIGCIAALRQNVTTGNHVDILETDSSGTTTTTLLPNDSFIYTWVKPVAGRDEGLALIGRRIRCHFSKSLVPEGKRVLEGEIVRLVGYEKAQKPGKPWKAEMLIERSMLQKFEFLVRVDQDVDVDSLVNDKARRNYRNEIRIKGGENLVTVKMRLLSPGSLADQEQNSVQWVIQKCVPAKLFQHSVSATDVSNNKGDGERKNGAASLKPLPKLDNGQKEAITQGQSRKRPRVSGEIPSPPLRHIGDGNDSPEQQVANWRWLVSNFHCLQKSCENQYGKDEVAFLGLIGKIIKMEPTTSQSHKTLALVTLQRVILPEHTRTGRLPHHRKFEVFEHEESSALKQHHFVVPIEELIVLGCSLHHCEVESNSSNPNGFSFLRLFTTYSYSNRTGIYFPLSDRRIHTDELSSCSSSSLFVERAACHGCSRMVPQPELHYCRNMSCEMYEDGVDTDFQPGWCTSCVLRCQVEENEDGEFDYLPCCYGLCDCHDCLVQKAVDLEDRLRMQVRSKRNRGTPSCGKYPFRFFGAAVGAADSCKKVDFALNPKIIDVTNMLAPAPHAMKRIRAKGKSLKRLLRTQTKNVDYAKTAGNRKNEQSDKKVEKEEDYSVFKPTCARAACYDSQKQMKGSFQWSDAPTDIPRNLREARPKSLLTETDPEDKTNASRAARAKQRMILKGVSNFSGLGIDILASRESQLRFGRSSIHAWGVFADRDIQQGDLIVEYRGEIIGNARAEKRELEYERAKIGSDYMFRIDKDTVCDATKLGNVARFINASCDPNCYTKIITVEGNKRIVVYAKKDISEGEELCYDYKFPLEYDPKKRIPCHCGARNCRGFMNWDKRYVVESSCGKETKEDGVRLLSSPAPSRMKSAPEF